MSVKGKERETESDSDYSSSSDSSSDDELPTQEYLDSLLAKARSNVVSNNVSSINDDEVILTLDEEPSNIPLPSFDPGILPQAYFSRDETKRSIPSSIRDPEVERAEKAATSNPVPPERPEVTLTKKQRKELKNKTAGPGWFDLPAPDPADLPRLYREIEALRLRNHLDPKRFYRKEEGEGKGIAGLPKHFAMGTIVTTNTPFGGASSDNLTRAERKRTFVEELVDDAEAKRYAKKKFQELQGVRGAKGKSKLAARQRRPKF